MKKLTLKNCRQESALLLDYEFIDNYMPEANGEYVKVYLLLLRCQAGQGADRLRHRGHPGRHGEGCDPRVEILEKTGSSGL